MRIYIKRTVYSNFEPLDVEDDYFAGGGQGKIYYIKTSGYTDCCLKKYTKDEDAVKSYDRIVYMIQSPPRNIIGSDSFRICWPTALAYDINRRFIGYIMPLAFPKSRDLKILEIYSSKPISQQAKYKKYPEWFDKFELDTEEGFKNRIKMMCNWAIALYHLHETSKYVVVDLKPENVMATATGKISVVDTDSFQISEAGKVLFEGPVGTPEYLPPEVNDMKKKNLPFSVSTDCFSAAVCFYSILTGVHPYAGMIKLPPFDKLENIKECIENDLFAYGSKKQYLRFPAGLNLQKHFENLPLTIQELFKRAFGQDYNHRPTMEEWGKALHEAAFSQTVFVKNVVKPAVSKTFSIKILDVIFADTDYNYNIIRPYGSTLYTDVAYLVPKIKYEVLRIGPDVEIDYRLFAPSGRLQEAGLSKPGYTNSSSVQCSSKGVFDFIFSGWGSDKKDRFKESGIWRIEFYENGKCFFKSQVNIQELNHIKKTHVPLLTPPSSNHNPNTTTTVNSNNGGNNSGFITLLRRFSSLIGVLATLGVIFLVIWGVVKLFFNDSDGVRSYVYTANTELYKSSEDFSENNVLTSLPYGTLVDVASQKGGLSEVEVDGKEGYVMGNMLLMEDDFKLLDGVWGNAMANECVSIGRYRLAILNYLKASHMRTGREGWQLMAKSMEVLPNSVLYPNMNNGYDKFSDFAFVLTNNKTNEMRVAVYSFTDDGQPKLVHEEQAEKAYIYSVTYRNGAYKINYSSASSSRNTVKNSDNVAPKETIPQRSMVSSSEVNTVSSVKKTQIVEDNNIYDAVDTQARFNGSVSSYIKKNLKYPAKAFMDGIKGTVVVSFVVEKTGEISNVQVARSAEPSLDREAVRLVKYMPLWSPAIKNGSQVRSRTSLSIVFE